MPNKLTGCRSLNCPALPVVAVLEVSCGVPASTLVTYYGITGITVTVHLIQLSALSP
jgi:hypothetical protein